MAPIKTALCMIVACLAGLAVSAEKVYDVADELDNRVAQEAELLEHHFIVLNDKLVDGTSSKEPAQNFEVLKSYQERYGGSYYIDRAVELLSSLPKSIESCDYASYEILAQNYLATKGRSHSGDGLRRVDGLVYHYAREHAIKCRPNYVERFEKFSAELPAEVGHFVAELFKDLPEKRLVKFAEYDTPVDMITSGVEQLTFSNQNVTTMLAALETLIKDEADKQLLYAQANERRGGFVASPDFRARIFDKYIAASCATYSAKSSEIFAPARFDAMLEDDQQQALLHPANEAFRQAWVNHRLCTRMLTMPPVDRFVDVIAARPPKQN